MDSPTVFHITHWKAGSQWVAEILKYSDIERFVNIEKHGIPKGFQIVRSLKLAPLIPEKCTEQFIYHKKSLYPQYRTVTPYRNGPNLKSPYAEKLVEFRHFKETLPALYCDSRLA